MILILRRSKTSMQKIGDIQGVVWHPKNADEIFVNNFAEVLVINVAKKTHRKIFVADDESSLSFFSLSPTGQAAGKTINWSLISYKLKQPTEKKSFIKKSC